MFYWLKKIKIISLKIKKIIFLIKIRKTDIILHINCILPCTAQIYANKLILLGLVSETLTSRCDFFKKLVDCKINWLLNFPMRLVEEPKKKNINENANQSN